MAKRRRKFTAQEKVSLLRRHLIDRTPVSEICDELNLQPTVFYRWMRTFFENGSVIFEKTQRKSKTSAAEQKIEALQAKIRRKDEVLGELLEEHVSLKKSLGEL